MLPAAHDLSDRSRLAIPAPSIPVATDNDPTLWESSIFLSHFLYRLSDSVTYAGSDWNAISALLRTSGVVPGPLARSQLVLPASDNPARALGLADALHADDDNPDAFFSIGEVVRLPGVLYGSTPPLTCGIIIGHNFMSPVYGLTEDRKSVV